MTALNAPMTSKYIFAAAALRAIIGIIEQAGLRSHAEILAICRNVGSHHRDKLGPGHSRRFRQVDTLSPHSSVVTAGWRGAVLSAMWYSRGVSSALRCGVTHPSWQAWRPINLLLQPLLAATKAGPRQRVHN